MRVRVAPDLCVGHGRCYALAPGVFDEDERGKCEIANENVPPALEEQARLGAASCPEGAIEIDGDPEREEHIRKR